MASDIDVRAIVDRINEDIVEVVSNYVDIKKNGSSYKGCCPFHKEKTASFMVSPAKGIFKCFGCGKGGDAIAFIQEQEQVGFREAVEIGTRKLGIPFEWKEQKNFDEKEHQHLEALRIACEQACRFFQESLEKSEEATNYLKMRGHDPNPEDPFRLGYAPSGNALLRWAKENAISEDILLEAGLIRKKEGENSLYDFFRERIMFPICSKNGKVVGFTGRTLRERKDTAKYLNTPDSPIFTKGHELFALNIAREAVRAENRVFLVEGNFDVRRLHSIGVTNAVAPCGTALTLEQARLIRKYTRNVTLVYDGDSAGRKAIVRNAETLIKEQCNVMVMELPEGEDPDTAFSTLADFEQTKERSNKDYILYKVEQNAGRCANPSFKNELIKDVSFLIAQYDEQALHEVYIDLVSKEVGPKKAWKDQVKMLVAEKAPVEKKNVVPKHVSADEYLEMGFYVENNCYFFANNKGEPVLRSNFALTPLFHIESVVNAKRLYEVANQYGQKRVIEIPQKDMVSRTAFMVHIESLGNFWWDGTDSDLSRLKRWLYEKTETCREITQLGWQKEGFFAWGNGIFDGEFMPVDSYGIVKHAKRSYYIPAFSSIFQNEDNLFQFERKFIHMEGNVTLKEYAKKFVDVFGDNAKIALCFYFSAVFRDIIVRRFGFFPILNMFGPKGAGKTACAESLVQFFGRLSKAPNVHNTSKPALGEHVASSCNALAHLDEYRNDIEMEKREFLKGLWDGVGRTKMNMEKDKKKETTSVDQAIILTGQQMATADIALFSRFVFLSFTQTEFTQQEKEAFQSLKETEKRGLTHITHLLLRLRALFADTYTTHLRKVGDRMRELLGREIVEDRIFNNWLIPVSAYITIADQLELPWDNDELIALAVKLMKRQNSEMKKNDDLGNFWKVVEYMATSNILFEDGDFKVLFTDKITRRYFEGTGWQKEEINLQKPQRVLFLTTSRVFSLYKSQCLREGDKPLPESTIEYYLRNSKAFLCETKKESFKKIDPKSGMQEVDDDGNKKRTSTTALVFDLEILGLNIGQVEPQKDLPF
jgi:DNA primase catalytic core